MPELPEVETIRRDLESKIVGARIQDVKFLWPGSLKEMKAEEFQRAVYHQKIVSVDRRAKNLAIKLEGGHSLLMHMKMTGHLLIEPASFDIDADGRWNDSEGALRDPLNQFIRVIFWLDNGKIMAFSDLRKFGYIKLVSAEELKKTWSDYGPEPFEENFSTAYLKDIFSKRKQAIKKVLMEQALIAGIGNIYADEILWETRIHPLRPASSLTETEIESIVEATRRILLKAIELRGTSTSDYRDTEGERGQFESELKAYKRTGQPCPRCGTPIERITVGGRGTHFCPKDQILEAS